MIVIGATAVPENRIISITKSTTSEEYFLEVIYEGAGGERIEKNIEYNNLGALDYAFKSAIGDHEAKNMKLYKLLVGNNDSHTYQESMSGARKTIRIGNDEKLYDVIHTVWEVDNHYLTKPEGFDKIENLVGSSNQ